MTTYIMDRNEKNVCNSALDIQDRLKTLEVAVTGESVLLYPKKVEVKNFKLSGGVNVIGNDGKVHKVYLTKVIYSNPVVVAFWSDGTKTSCKVQHKDSYSCDAGLGFCALKKMMGGDAFADMLKYWTPELDVLDYVIEEKQPVTVSLKDVRKKEKAEGRLK